MRIPLPSYFCTALVIVAIGCNSPTNSSYKPGRNNPTDTVYKKETNSSVPARTVFLKMDTLDQLPPDYRSLIKGAVRRVFRVDFNGDGKQDFICQQELTNKPDYADYLETWITSGKQIIRTDSLPDMDVCYFYFANLDNDREPEIIYATGYEDGVDYVIYDQDLKKGDHFLLFYFNPVIIENGKNFWGYPWDMQDIILKKDSAHTYLKASFDHDIERDEEVIVSDSAKKRPAIFFSGHSTQPNIKVGNIRKIKWMTLDELK